MQGTKPRAFLILGKYAVLSYNPSTNFKQNIMTGYSEKKAQWVMVNTRILGKASSDPGETKPVQAQTLGQAKPVLCH